VMKRMSSVDVVNAYKATGLIPIRKAWEADDSRGGCAIDAVARHLEGIHGEAWADANLEHNYTRGFVDAWDADTPVILDETQECKEFLIGYWDAIICRDAVEREFASSVSEYNTAPEK
jgi:hypothetical protein